MKILITGGTGTVGREAVKRLVANGHDVLVVGRRKDMVIEGASYRACDITNYTAVREAARGREGIVHLAAIANPSLAPGQELFRVNATGTYNVFEAAAQEGIDRVVQASSINAFGYFFGVEPFSLRYFPIDEAHETCTSDPYSFSKQVIEEIAHYYWRRDGINSVSLRLPGVYEVGGPSELWISAHRLKLVERYREIMAMEPSARNQRVTSMVSKYNKAVRETRAFEQAHDEHIIDRISGALDVWLMVQRDNFWTSLDARDSAQAIALGLTADYEGSHALFINDDRNDTGLGAGALTETFFPGVPWKQEPIGDESLVSIARAQEILGFTPIHHATNPNSETRSATQ